MGSESRSSLLPAGQVTFLVTDDSVDVFDSAAPAVAVALARQRATPEAHRAAIATGDARRSAGGDYSGPARDRGIRMHAITHPGQTSLSSLTATLVANELPDGAWLEDLGVHRLDDLLQPERIFELRHAELTAGTQSLSTFDAHPNNLPSQFTSFIGRVDELAAVTQLLHEERLVTLTGSGGCGKTRLAIHAAAGQAGLWPDGIWWVELAALNDRTAVAELVASTMGILVEPGAGPLQALKVQLHDRRFLVCLDNCEHLLDASAEVAEILVRSCPDASVLATSRELLGVPGELVWPVPSLVESEAVALFVERASRVRPWLTLDATNRAAVIAICRQLDGIPLAIELAAAWQRALTPSQIAAGLNDRLALSARGPRTASVRQQTMGASIAWSHDLLDEVDRVVLRRLSVFAGGFTLDAARTVGAGDGIDVLQSLASLVDKSLVVVEERDGAARYRLLETIRQYASDCLEEADETATVRDLHLESYLAFAEDAARHVMVDRQDVSLTGLTVEHDNLRAALEWAFAHSTTQRARRLAAAMVWLWFLRGYAHEGLESLRHAIELEPHDRSPLQAELHCGIATVAVAGGQFAVVAENAERALEIAVESGDDTYRGRALFLLAVVQSYVDVEQSCRLCVEARDAAEAAGDPFVIDAATVVQGVALSIRDRFDEAHPLLRDGAERCMLRNDRYMAAYALRFLAGEKLLTGSVLESVELAEQALTIARPLGDYYSIGQATAQVALAMGTAGDIDGARRLLEEVVRSVDGAGGRAYVPLLAHVMGTLCLWAGDHAGAVGWFERDVRYADPQSPKIVPARSLPGLAGALRQLDRCDEARDRAAQALETATKLEIWHLVAEAVEQSALLVPSDRPDLAEDLHHQALALRVEHGLRTVYVDSLDALAILAARSESWEEAARVLAASDSARAEMSCPRPPVARPAYDGLMATLQGNLGDDAFASAAREGAALSLDDAVAFVRRARGSRGRPSSGWPSLTSTELEVVRLVAEGLSNPAIGARMFISRGTVKTHLSHIFAKLGVANRTELATIASAHFD